MDTVFYIIFALLFLNAVAAFFIAFFWQAKVIFLILRTSSPNNSFVPWKALGDPESPQVMMGRFFAGEIYPELRRKWGKAIVYVVISFVTLFVVVGLSQVFAPDLLN